MEPLIKNRLVTFILLLESGKYKLTGADNLNPGGNNRSLAGFLYETYMLLTGKGCWEVKNGVDYLLLNLGPCEGRWTYEIADSVGLYFGLPIGIHKKIIDDHSIKSLNDRSIPEIVDFFKVLCAG